MRSYRVCAGQENIMENFSETLLSTYAVRRRAGEKDAFLTFAYRAFSAIGRDVSVQRAYPLGIRCDNIIAGSLRHARTVFLAPYDTPFTALFPYVARLDSRALTFLLYLLPFLALAAASAAIALALKLPLFTAITLFLLLAFAANLLVINTHNPCCTSSAVIAAYEAIRRAGEGCAVVLLDNSQLFSLGALAFSRQFSESLEGKQLIYFDHPGRGDRLVARIAKGSSAPPPELFDAVFCAGRKGAPIKISAAKKQGAGYVVSGIRSAADTHIDEPILARAIDAAVSMARGAKLSRGASNPCSP